MDVPHDKMVSVFRNVDVGRSPHKLALLVMWVCLGEWTRWRDRLTSRAERFQAVSRLDPASKPNETAALSLRAGTKWSESLSLSGKCGDGSTGLPECNTIIQYNYTESIDRPWEISQHRYSAPGSGSVKVKV